MIVNFGEDMKFRFPTSAGPAILKLSHQGKSICMAIEFDGTELEIKPLEFAGVNAVTRSENGPYRWTLRGEDGNEYGAELELNEYPPQIIEAPAIRARYFAEMNGGLLETGGRHELGRLSEGR